MQYGSLVMIALKTLRVKLERMMIFMVEAVYRLAEAHDFSMRRAEEVLE